MSDTNDMEDIVKEFLIESYENLDQLDKDLVTLEKNPSDLKTLSSIFRTIHTIKGTCGFLAFTKLGSIVHVGENLLSRLRDREMNLTPELTNGLLAMEDAVRQVLANIEATGEEGDGDYSPVVETLTQLQGEAEPPPSADEASTDATASSENLTSADIEMTTQAENASISSQIEGSNPSEKNSEGRDEEHVSENAAVKAEESSDVPQFDERIGAVLVELSEANSDDVEYAAQKQQMGDPRHIGEILVEEGVVQPKEVVEALNRQKTTASSNVSDSSIRVDVELLGKLMNQVGELVLARNQIVQFTTTQEDRTFVAASQRLDLITTELQEAVMKTRMQSIGTIWNKFPRVVRDLATLGEHTIRGTYYGTAGIDDATDAGANMVGVAIDRAFTDRTVLYVAFAMTSNESQSALPMSGAGHGAHLLLAPGEDPLGVAIGLNHTF